jgi:hypothetical protein
MIIYISNENNSCFSISGVIDMSGRGAPPDEVEVKEVYSTALGKVNLAFVGFEKASDKPYIAVSGYSNFDFGFYSPSQSPYFNYFCDF